MAKNKNPIQHNVRNVYGERPTNLRDGNGMKYSTDMTANGDETDAQAVSKIAARARRSDSFSRGSVGKEMPAKAPESKAPESKAPQPKDDRDTHTKRMEWMTKSLNESAADGERSARDWAEQANNNREASGSPGLQAAALSRQGHSGKQHSVMVRKLLDNANPDDDSIIDADLHDHLERNSESYKMATKLLGKDTEYAIGERQKVKDKVKADFEMLKRKSEKYYP